MQSDRLLKLCAFFDKRLSSLRSDAELKDDMVKRIFLSIIPAVSSKTELYHTSGFPDYNLLKSAANGAFDLVKYGTAACIGELDHYGNGESSPKLGYASYVKQHKDQFDAATMSQFANAVSEGTKPVPMLAKKYLEIAKAFASSGNNRMLRLKAAENFGKALSVCIDAFNDFPAWDTAYGGRAWARIAKTLHSLNANTELLLKP